MSLNVLITGHTSGIGNDILHHLISAGCTITGISRKQLNLNISELEEASYDLSDTTEIIKACNFLKTKKFNAIILNAGYNAIKPPESYRIEDVIKICTLNFTAHAAIMRACLPNLIQNKGCIIGIGSFSGTEVEKWNNYYGSAKAGFHHLLANMFEQYRKQGIRVTNIIPDITNTPFYSHQDFEPGSDPNTSINSKEVSKLVYDLILNPPTYVPTQIIIRPQRFELNKKVK